MNILITTSNEYARYFLVMLKSLYQNNPTEIHVYCLCHNLSEDYMTKFEKQAEYYHATMHFVPVDPTAYQDFPTTKALTTECYYTLLAHELLPQDMDKILYLDGDLIINGDIQEFYSIDLEDYYMVVCGQYHKLIDGKPYKTGARPDKGQCFNSGVLLFNLRKFREDHIDQNTYLNAAKQANYDFLADQGLLNLLFWDKVKYENTLIYNFRINMYENYIWDEKTELPYEPLIYHYITHDNYIISKFCKVWDLLLTPEEYQDLSDKGIARRAYGDELIVQRNQSMLELWWKYAEGTDFFSEIHQKMIENKQKALQEFSERFQQNQESFFRKKEIIHKIAAGEDCTREELRSCGYMDMASYIDRQSPEKAIQTMNHVFEMNLNRIKQQERIKIAFVVYSSSEWQCEDLYRKLEADERFEPVLFICAYAHGTEEQFVRTYKNTCEYFEQSEKPYQIEFGGYEMHQKDEHGLNDYDILVYFTPNEVLRPYQNNPGQRHLGQLMIHIPYGIYLVDKKDAYYMHKYYDMRLFRLCWRYFTINNLEYTEAKNSQRLQGYNIMVSGSVKMDPIVENRVEVRPSLWKETTPESIKIIWAPHFNMQDKMNGTFHENYQWFYQYAKEHPEVSWIVRPHPRMEIGVLEKGLFQNGAEYREYLDQWDALPNARVIPFGDYLDIFITSDAMILDSISFLAEYQYTGNPLLFLKSVHPRAMGDAGTQLLSCLYSTRGNNYEDITKFIEHVSKKEDSMFMDRKNFYNENLNAVKTNGCSATQFIYDILQSSCTHSIDS